MTTTFNTRSSLSRIAEIATFVVMVGLSATPAAMALDRHTNRSAEVSSLPTVIVTAEGATEVTRFETIYVTGKRINK